MKSKGFTGSAKNSTGGDGTEEIEIPEGWKLDKDGVLKEKSPEEKLCEANIAHIKELEKKLEMLELTGKVLPVG